jgi:hypothetical protein
VEAVDEEGHVERERRWMGEHPSARKKRKNSGACCEI